MEKHFGARSTITNLAGSIWNESKEEVDWHENKGQFSAESESFYQASYKMDVVFYERALINTFYVLDFSKRVWKQKQSHWKKPLNILWGVI